MELEHHWLGQGVDYEKGLSTQESTVQSILGGTLSNQLISLEHAPVYTIGRTRDQSSLGAHHATLPHPVVVINRGGQATYHGPGQLTGYPIVDLRHLGRDLHSYIRNLEEALIRTCLEFDVSATRRDGLTGVWVENRKLASIGVGVRKWISMHGYAINITNESLNGFLPITPCGIDGVKMTSLEQECGQPVDVKTFSQKAHNYLKQILGSMMISANK